MRHSIGGGLLARGLAGLGIILAATSTVVAAEAPFPSKPIHVIVPAGTGGNLDLTARVIGQHMSETLGQAFVIENRAGGNALTGTRMVQKAAPDGYTLLAISNTFAISPSVIANTGYDPVKDFSGIGLMNSVSLLAVVSAVTPYRTLQDYVTAAKASPGKLSYASGGTGTTTHLAAAMFAEQAGLQLLHVPYKGNAPAIPDVLSGQVLIIFDPINTSSPLVKEGKFRALGYTGSRRAALHPEVPTVAELGYPGYEFSIYTGLVAPAGTPREVIARLHAALSKARGSKELRDRFVREGTEMSADDSVEQFNEFLRREVTRYTSVVKAANIKVE